MNDQPDRRAGPDRDGRLDLQVAGGDLIAGAGHVLLRGLADSLDEIAFPAECHVRANAKQGRNRDALEQRPVWKST